MSADVRITLSDDALEQLAQRVADILEERARSSRANDRDRRWLSVDEAAAYIASSKQRIYDLRSSGRLTRHGDGRRALISRAELDQLISGGQR
jgi:excisionase family DNA binding protein